MQLTRIPDSYAAETLHEAVEDSYADCISFVLGDDGVWVAEIRTELRGGCGHSAWRVDDETQEVLMGVNELARADWRRQGEVIP